MGSVEGTVDGKTDGDLLEGELDVGLVVNGTLVGKQLGPVILELG